MSIFIRNILIDLDEAQENVMRVSAHMKDVVHDIRVSLFVSLPDYTIIDVSLEMRETPEKACQKLNDVIGSIKGIKIEAGFNTKIKRLLSGKTGCTNVLSLLTVAAPLVINISWFLYRKKNKMSDEEYQKMKRADMIDKCIAFSETSDAEAARTSLSSGEEAIVRDCARCSSVTKGDNIKKRLTNNIMSLSKLFDIPEATVEELIKDVELLEKKNA
ncbi:MAG: DUF2889 domain-containing protein [Candidatus Schekmanbacteria bacterium]|nr:DUF2889 domain-containing protein [Candidatus Schekmanbacteria bacterium]